MIPRANITAWRTIAPWPDNAQVEQDTFLADVPILLRTGLDYDPAVAWPRVHAALVSRVPGEPWNGG